MHKIVQIDFENFENVSNKIDENLADDVENDIEQNHGEKDSKPN